VINGAVIAAVAVALELGVEPPELLAGSVVDAVPIPLEISIQTGTAAAGCLVQPDPLILQLQGVDGQLQAGVSISVDPLVIQLGVEPPELLAGSVIEGVPLVLQLDVITPGIYEGRAQFCALLTGSENIWNVLAVNQLQAQRVCQGRIKGETINRQAALVARSVTNSATRGTSLIGGRLTFNNEV